MQAGLLFRLHTVELVLIVWIILYAAVEPFWLHTPLSNLHRNEVSRASNALSLTLYTLYTLYILCNSSLYSNIYQRTVFPLISPLELLSHLFSPYDCTLLLSVVVQNSFCPQMWLDNITTEAVCFNLTPDLLPTSLN